MTSLLSSLPDEERYQKCILNDLIKKVTDNSIHIKRYILENKLNLVLDTVVEVLKELRTEKLSSKYYYDLYVIVLEQLSSVEEYLLTLHKHKQIDISKLYEQVQSYCQILPRLYLLCCVGSIYLMSASTNSSSESNEATKVATTPPAMNSIEILQDMLEMLKGVQHPLRGLFLRNYMMIATKNKLIHIRLYTIAPEPRSREHSTSELTVDPHNNISTSKGLTSAYEFILENFIQSNRLWIRLQPPPPTIKSPPQLHQLQSNPPPQQPVAVPVFVPVSVSPVSSETNPTTANQTIIKTEKKDDNKTKIKKDTKKERLELRLLVGINLVRLSCLNGLNPTQYKLEILPKLCDEIIQCKDTIAQSYLMDCIIQVFPVSFHIITLEKFLQVCLMLKEKVNVRVIIEAIMNKLIESSHDFSVTTVTASATVTTTTTTAVSLSSHSLPSTEDSHQSLHTTTFELFHQCITSLIAKRFYDASTSSASLLESLKLYTALMNFTMKCFSDRMDYISLCLQSSLALIDTAVTATGGGGGGSGSGGAFNKATVSVNSSSSSSSVVHSRWPEEVLVEVEQLLSLPLLPLTIPAAASCYSTRVLDVPAYNTLLSHLPPTHWKRVSLALLHAIMTARSRDSLQLNSYEQYERLFYILTPLLKDPSSTYMATASTSNDNLKWKDEQQLVAKLMPLLTPRSVESVVAPAGSCDNSSSTSSSSSASSSSLVVQEDACLADTGPVQSSSSSSSSSVVFIDTDLQVRIYLLARKSFIHGGIQRMYHTIPPLVMATMQLAQLVFRRECYLTSVSDIKLSSFSSSDTSLLTAPLQYSSKKIFQYVLEEINLVAAAYPEIALYLFLPAAVAADHCYHSGVCYEFWKESLLLYECEISDSKLQVKCLTFIINSLIECHSLPLDEYDALSARVVQYANKLLRKADQCHLLALCSHLYWHSTDSNATTTTTTTTVTTATAATHATATSSLSLPTTTAVAAEAVATPSMADSSHQTVPSHTTVHRKTDRHTNPQKVLECLQKALKIASVSDPNLFVEILDRYIYFYEKGCVSIQAKYITALIALIYSQQVNDRGTGSASAVTTATMSSATSVTRLSHATLTHYRNTVDYIKSRQKSPEAQDRFSQIELIVN